MARKQESKWLFRFLNLLHFRSVFFKIRPNIIEEDEANTMVALDGEGVASFGQKMLKRRRFGCFLEREMRNKGENDREVCARL